MSPTYSKSRPTVGDTVITADDLSDGDIVYFDRVGPNRILVRVMTDDLLATYVGPIFAVVIRDPSGKAEFTEVSRDDVA